MAKKEWRASRLTKREIQKNLRKQLVVQIQSFRGRVKYKLWS